ncbi:HpcH/HpaI aldolase family protein [Salinilacihabitans rarus]|uniref:HpcH/HpaI aldolase family protein n=1 Tax=Salinilacihabitans rarus TaxID=2961596 RepID=UPI0020C8B277|nr:aldolase/citrate lyase family protein [Salinilacihabitans rarus]
MTLASTLRARDPAVGNWLTLADPAVAEISAELGFDFVVVDVEHTPHSLETALELVRAVDAADADAEALVRLPWNDPVVAKRVLDFDVAGVLAPMIGSADEAASLVEATRYPPEGVRGVAGGRAARYGIDLEGYVERANDEILTVAQIETVEGLENVEEIAAVDGLDALFLGPADLSASLGRFGEWDSDAFLDAVDRVLDAAHAVDKPVSTLALGDEEIERWLDRGFDFVMAGLDASYVVEGSRRAKSTFEAAVEEREG